MRTSSTPSSGWPRSDDGGGSTDDVVPVAGGPAAPSGDPGGGGAVRHPGAPSAAADRRVDRAPRTCCGNRGGRSRDDPPTPDPRGADARRPRRSRGRDGAAAERHRRPALRGDGDPGLRRVREHVGHRHGPDPDGGGEGGRTDLRVAPAELDPRRGRGVQRYRVLDARADR